MSFNVNPKVFFMALWYARFSSDPSRDVMSTPRQDVTKSGQERHFEYRGAGFWKSGVALSLSRSVKSGSFGIAIPLILVFWDMQRLF